jgi:hypothetical protein
MMPNKLVGTTILTTRLLLIVQNWLTLWHELETIIIRIHIKTYKTI